MLWVIDILFAVALMLAPVVWIMDPLRIAPLPFTIHWGWKPLLAPVVLLLFGAAARRWSRRKGTGARGLWERGLFRKAVLAAGATFLFFLGLETALRAVGFEARLPPIAIRTGPRQEETRTRAVVSDRELLWRFNPGATIEGYEINNINNLGFADRDVDPQKQPGTRRVICMGDSVSAQGLPPYSGILHEKLAAAPPTAQAWEAFNMAVIGYSSAQGLRLFQKRGRELEPDVVTVFYGWNDHWLGDRPDSLRMAVRMNRLSGGLVEKLRRKRFFQLLVYAADPVRRVARTGEGSDYRVPPEEYRWNLKKLVAEIRSAGALPILVTAPRSSELDASLASGKQGRSVEEIIRAHDRYVAITREVAAASGADLVDLAAVLGGISTNFFRGDGIHLTQEGLTRVAEELYAKLQAISGEDAANGRR